MNTNKLYGIGVGVGDPEQLTMKAVNILKKLDVVVVPEAAQHSGSVAFNIAKEYLKKELEVIFMEFPMLKDVDERISSRKNNTKIIENLLDKGKNIGFLTIGDPMTYSTYVYILENINKKYNKSIETISGISSFADMSSRFNFPLVMGDETLKVISLNSDTDIKKELENNDNIVFMKIKRDFERLKEALMETNNLDNIIMVSNSGKENQRIFYDIKNLTIEDVPYFTTMVFKKGGFSQWKKFSL